MVLGIPEAHLSTVNILARSLSAVERYLKCVSSWALIGKHHLRPQGISINGAGLVIFGLYIPMFLLTI